MEAIEEALSRELGWRAEARARAEVITKGGVLADEVSYGKTAVTLALIHAEFEEKDAEAIVEDFASLEPTDLIDTAATLVICPPQMTAQWRSEISKFLGDDLYGKQDVLVIKNLKDLLKLTVQDFQEAKIIIVSWNVLTSDGYISRLAHFAAVPEPTDTKGRAFAAWMDYAMTEIPKHLQWLKDVGVKDCEKRLTEKFRTNLENPDLQGFIPSKRLRGKEYVQKRQALALATSSSTKNKWNDKSRSVRGVCPLFQMFRYNRVVVDEFTYLKGRDYTSITRMAADKRWVLSGTPPLRDFVDVKRIAAFLGLSLGVADIMPGVIFAQNIKQIDAEQTSKMDQTKTLVTCTNPRRGRTIPVLQRNKIFSLA